jgi:hypothetical protein
LRGDPQSAAVVSSRPETPALVAGDSGLGDSPRQTPELAASDARPELGRRLSVSGRRIRAGMLRPETPVPRGQRLRSVRLG